MTTNTFIAGKGFLYRFDPRAKLLLLVLLCAFVFLPVSMPGLWLVVAVVFLTTWSSTGFKQALHPLRSILPLLIIMVVFIPLTHRDSEVVLSISGFPLVTTGALENFNLLAARFIGITYMLHIVLLDHSDGRHHVDLALVRVVPQGRAGAYLGLQIHSFHSRCVPDDPGFPLHA